MTVFPTMGSRSACPHSLPACPGRERPLYRRGELPGAERYYAESLSFPTTNLHEPCDDLLDQYREGLRRVLERKAVPA